MVRALNIGLRTSKSVGTALPVVALPQTAAAKPLGTIAEAVLDVSGPVLLGRPAQVLFLKATTYRRIGRVSLGS
jgi:hypothetical protein